MTNARSVAELLKHSCQISSADASDGHSNKTRGSAVDYQGTKYLTSSQLFGLQLRDPLLRQQVAVQLLLFAHYLKYDSRHAVFLIYADLSLISQNKSSSGSDQCGATLDVLKGHHISSR